MLALQFSDTQCGFKAFRSRAAHAIFSNQRVDGWGFDAETLFLAKKRGFKVTEIPVISSHDEDSRLEFMADGLKMVWDIFQVRLRAVAGDYPTPARSQPKIAKLNLKHGESEAEAA